MLGESLQIESVRKAAHRPTARRTRAAASSPEMV
jgi:hypothetical protein